MNAKSGAGSSVQLPCDHRWRRTDDGLDLYCLKCGICCPEDDDYTRADAEGLCAIAGIDTQNREVQARDLNDCKCGYGCPPFEGCRHP